METEAEWPDQSVKKSSLIHRFKICVHKIELYGLNMKFLG